MGFLENIIRINLPKGPPLGFGEICVDFWDFRRGAPEPPFLLLLFGTFLLVGFCVEGFCVGCG